MTDRLHLNSFAVAQFKSNLLYFQSFITCSIGIWNVGFIMICYGVVDSLCSVIFGRLVQYCGHIPFFILGRLSYIRFCCRGIIPAYALPLHSENP